MYYEKDENPTTILMHNTFRNLHDYCEGIQSDTPVSHLSLLIWF